jgi:hypothetical protein
MLKQYLDRTGLTEASPLSAGDLTVPPILRPAAEFLAPANVTLNEALALSEE